MHIYLFFVLNRVYRFFSSELIKKVLEIVKLIDIILEHIINIFKLVFIIIT